MSSGAKVEGTLPKQVRSIDRQSLAGRRGYELLKLGQPAQAGAAHGFAGSLARKLFNIRITGRKICGGVDRKIPGGAARQIPR